MRRKTLNSGFIIPIGVCMLLLALRDSRNVMPGTAGLLSDSHSDVKKLRTDTIAGGDILGIVVPFSVKTSVLLVSVSDTIAHTFSDTTNGAYMLKNIPPGNYALIYIPSDNRYRKTSNRAAVSGDQITIADTTWLQK